MATPKKDDKEQAAPTARERAEHVEHAERREPVMAPTEVTAEDLAPLAEQPVDIAAEVERNRAEGYARQAAGRPFTEDPHDPRAEEVARERADQYRRMEERYLEGDMIIADPEAVIRARPAETIKPMPAPGLDERGWSAEVTARHPAIVADALEQIASEQGGGRRARVGSASAEAMSLEEAQDIVRDHGFAQARRTMVQHEATMRAYHTLAAMDGAREEASPFRRMAVAQVAEQMRDAAEGRGLAPTRGPSGEKTGDR